MTINTIVTICCSIMLSTLAGEGAQWLLHAAKRRPDYIKQHVRDVHGILTVNPATLDRQVMKAGYYIPPRDVKPEQYWNGRMGPVCDSGTKHQTCTL